MILWLWQRAISVETHLRNELVAANKLHSLKDLHGLTLALLIWFSMSIPPVAGAVFAILSLDGKSGTLALYLGLTKAVIALGTLYFVARISWQSYYSQEWSSASDILKEYFDTSKWWGAHKLDVHIRLPARLQKAFNVINHKDSQVGRH